MKLTRDDNPFVRQAALGHLALIVQDKALADLMPATEVAQTAEAVLDDPAASELLRGMASIVLNLATNK